MVVRLEIEAAFQPSYNQALISAEICILIRLSSYLEWEDNERVVGGGGGGTRPKSCNHVCAWPHKIPLVKILVAL